MKRVTLVIGTPVAKESGEKYSEIRTFLTRVLRCPSPKVRFRLALRSHFPLIAGRGDMQTHAALRVILHRLDD